MITEKTPLELKLADLLVENTSCSGEEADKVIPMIFSLLDSNKHEPQVMKKNADVIVLTIQEIYNLATFAGLWINEEDSTNDRTSEIAIRENVTIPMDSGEKDWHGRAAYYVDYPEDKSVIIKEE